MIQGDGMSQATRMPARFACGGFGGAVWSVRAAAGLPHSKGDFDA
jgi:hypothetical protein